MEVRWSALAVEDLERIFRRIEKDNPTAARETVKAIYDSQIGFGKGTASQAAEKLDLALDFGWRSALALR